MNWLLITLRGGGRRVHVLCSSSFFDFFADFRQVQVDDDVPGRRTVERSTLSSTLISTST